MKEPFNSSKSGFPKRKALMSLFDLQLLFDFINYFVPSDFGDHFK